MYNGGVHRAGIRRETVEAHLSAQAPQAQARARVPQAYEYAGWKKGDQEAKAKGEKAADGLNRRAGAYMRTLKREYEFKAVYDRGLVLPGKAVIVYALKRRGAGRRFGFVVGRKVGKAVRRNRVRRLLKEICRTRETLFPAGYDYVLIARAGAAGRPFKELLDELTHLLGRMVGRHVCS